MRLATRAPPPPALQSSELEQFRCLFSDALCMEFLDFALEGTKKTSVASRVIWLLDIAILLVVIVVAAALIVAVLVLLTVCFLQSF